jgi:L-Ala-D/L-Glu epimerase
MCARCFAYDNFMILSYFSTKIKLIHTNLLNILEISALPYTLQLKKPFKIAAGIRSYTNIILVEITQEGMTGFGEASLPPYLEETPESVLNFINNIKLKKIQSPDDIANLLKEVDNSVPGNNAAKASIDIALHDLKGKLLNKSLTDFLNLKYDDSKSSSMTIGINDLESVIKDIEQAREFDYLKIKLGSKYDKDVVNYLTRVYKKKFCIDVNRGWTNKYFALEMLKMLKDSSCIYIEQPFETSMIRETMWLSDQSSLPIIADESVKRLSDIKNADGVFHGINIKLMKSTGIYEANKMIEEGRNKNMKIVLGSMTETSCAQSAAAHLCSLVDWVDLDSAFLTANDCFNGMEVVEGKIKIKKELPGIGALKL